MYVAANTRLFAVVLYLLLFVVLHLCPAGQRCKTTNIWISSTLLSQGKSLLYVVFSLRRVKKQHTTRKVPCCRRLKLPFLYKPYRLKWQAKLDGIIYTEYNRRSINTPHIPVKNPRRHT